MFNMLLDRMPEEYKGYLIRTDYRIGIQIMLCLKDEELSDEERTITALSLLYGNGIPSDIELAIEGLKWFLSCGNDNKSGDIKKKELFFFDFDNDRLYSSFMVSYNIDLTKDKLHWFKFISLIGSLTKDCAFSKAVEIRDFDMKDLKGKQRMEMARLKRELSPQSQYTEEDKAKMAEFDAIFSGGDVNG